MKCNSLKIQFSNYLQLAVLAFLPALAAFTSAPVKPAVTSAIFTCSAPSPSRTGQSHGANTYAWSAVSGATQYAMFYVRKSDGFTSSVTYTTATSHTFSGLTAGNYAFYFATVCDGAALSDYIIVDDMVIE